MHSNPGLLRRMIGICWSIYGIQTYFLRLLEKMPKSVLSNWFRHGLLHLVGFDVNSPLGGLWVNRIQFFPWVHVENIAEPCHSRILFSWIENSFQHSEKFLPTRIKGASGFRVSGFRACSTPELYLSKQNHLIYELRIPKLVLDTWVLKTCKIRKIPRGLRIGIDWIHLYRSLCGSYIISRHWRREGTLIPWNWKNSSPWSRTGDFREGLRVSGSAIAYF